MNSQDNQAQGNSQGQQTGGERNFCAGVVKLFADVSIRAEAGDHRREVKSIQRGEGQFVLFLIELANNRRVVSGLEGPFGIDIRAGPMVPGSAQAPLDISGIGAQVDHYGASVVLELKTAAYVSGVHSLQLQVAV